MDQLAAIRLFVRIVEAGSMTKASASLNMPKSTASKLLSELEAHLGTKLLQRSTRSISLTNEGRDYFERAGRLMVELQDIDASLQAMGAGLSGKVRVDVHSSMANLVIIPALEEFRQLYPDIQIALGISDRPISLIEDAVDCVIRMGTLEDTTLVARTIYRDPILTCASPGYLQQNPAPTTPHALTECHQTVGYFSALNGEIRPMLFQKNGETVQVRKANILANDSMGHVNMIVSGLGIGQAYLSTVRFHLAAGKLVRVLDDWTTGAEPISVLYPPSRQLNARVRAFIDWLTDYLTKNIQKPV